MIKFIIDNVKKGNKLIHKFKNELIKSKINRSQIKKFYFNLGDIRWASVDLLSNFKKYNLHIAKFEIYIYQLIN